DEPRMAQIAAGAAERRGGMVAVSNVGDDEFWTGHPLAQSNLFALGRLAWDWTADAGSILAEWISATFGVDQAVRSTLRELLAESWLLYESYTATGRGIHGAARPSLRTRCRRLRVHALGDLSLRRPCWHRCGPQRRHRHRVRGAVSRALGLGVRLRPHLPVREAAVIPPRTVHASTSLR